MRKLTRKEALKKHRQMWNMIADMIKNGERHIDIASYKIKALAVMEESCIMCECFCCDITFMDCKECLVIWNNNEYCRCIDQHGEYSIIRELIECGEWDEAEEVARTIANLPARYKEDEEE